MYRRLVGPALLSPRALSVPRHRFNKNSLATIAQQEKKCIAERICIEERTWIDSRSPVKAGVHLLTGLRDPLRVKVQGSGVGAQGPGFRVQGADCIRTSIYDKYSGSTKLTSHLYQSRHCKTASGTN